MSPPAQDPPLLVAVTGGSGSGKSTVADALCAAVGEARALRVADDHYYFDNGGQPGVDAALVDFDAPASKDLGLLAEHVRDLKSGLAIARPTYCFARHARLPETVRLTPRPLVVVEGIHVLCDPALAALFDVAVYVDAPDDLRFIRRLVRDVRERARTADSVVAQYLATVRPAYEAHVMPARARADVIVVNDRQCDTAAARDMSPVFEAIRARRPSLL
jgi:uridine kinase